MLRFSDEITQDRDTVLFFAPPDATSLTTGMQAVLTLVPEPSTSQTITLSADYRPERRRFESVANTLDWPIGRHRQASIRYEVDGEVRRYAFEFDCVHHAWTPSVSANDLTLLVPSLAVEQTQDGQSLCDLLEFAEAELRAACRLRGFSPGACLDPERLDRILTQKALSLAFVRQTPQANESKLAASLQWQRKAEQAFLSLLIDAPFDWSLVDAQAIGALRHGPRMMP